MIQRKEVANIERENNCFIYCGGKILMMEAFQLCPHHESGIMRIEDDADFSLSHSRFDYRYCTMFRSLKNYTDVRYCLIDKGG